MGARRRCSLSRCEGWLGAQRERREHRHHVNFRRAGAMADTLVYGAFQPPASAQVSRAWQGTAFMLAGVGCSISSNTSLTVLVERHGRHRPATQTIVGPQPRQLPRVGGCVPRALGKATSSLCVRLVMGLGAALRALHEMAVEAGWACRRTEADRRSSLDRTRFLRGPVRCPGRVVFSSIATARWHSDRCLIHA